MEEEVRQALVAAGFDAADIHLEVTQSGNVGGFIVSPRFSDLSQIERQERLWADLKQRLRPEMLQRIVSILTMTPAEVEDDIRVANG